jgi:hypothetical protein
MDCDVKIIDETKTQPLGEYSPYTRSITVEMSAASADQLPTTPEQVQAAGQKVTGHFRHDWDPYFAPLLKDLTLIDADETSARYLFVIQVPYTYDYGPAAAVA